MAKAIVALKLYRKSYVQLAEFAAVVIAGLTANLMYPMPNPALPTVTADLLAFNTALAAWGTKGNRGAHQKRVLLLAARDVLRKDLTMLATYAQNLTPYDPVALGSVGWELKKPANPVGILQAVRDLVQFISRRVNKGTIKLKWGKPLNAVDVKVSGYSVRRSNTPDFAQSVEVGNTTKTSFTDLAPGVGLRYYWVIPFNAAGDGVLSDICAAAAIPIPA